LNEGLDFCQTSRVRRIEIQQIVEIMNRIFHKHMQLYHEVIVDNMTTHDNIQKAEDNKDGKT
jgi:hypothetical protein